MLIKPDEWCSICKGYSLQGHEHFPVDLGTAVEFRLRNLKKNEILALTEEDVAYLQNKFPDWIPARGDDGKVRVTNFI